MKRYQCIKTWYSDENKSGCMFVMGKIYNGDSVSVTDHSGDRIEVFQDELEQHFQELMDLHVDEHEEEKYTAQIPQPKALATGCAIVVAAILTIIVTLLSLI